MDNNHTLKVLTVQVLRNQDGKQNVINAVTVSVRASNELDSASIVKTCKIDASNIENFVEFENLTEPQVLGWVTDLVGEAEVQNWYAEVDSFLTKTIAPNETFVNPPWM
jgi:hypothetical protein